MGRARYWWHMVGAVGLGLGAAGVPAFGAPQGYVRTFQCERPPLGLKLPQSYRALRRLAPIEQEQVIDAEETDGAEIERRVIIFKGLELAVVLFPDEADRYRVEAAVVTAPRWRVTGPLHVGLSALEARARLRRLHAVPDHALGFGSEGGTVSLKQAKGVITQIAYSCYVG
jgi:hypothetical protein